MELSVLKLIFLLHFIILICLLYGNNETEKFTDNQLSVFSLKDLPAKVDNNSFFEKKSIIVWGTQTSDEDELETNEMMAHNIVDFRVKKWLGQTESIIDIIEDEELTIEHIKNYNLFLIGTSSSNIWLHKIQEYLPIKITDNEIKILDKSFEGDEVGVSFRYPNPLYHANQIWVISAPSYEAMRFIPKFEEYSIYKITDYNLQSHRFMELAQGCFDENWQLTEVIMVDNEEIYSGEDDSIDAVEIKDYPPPQWIKNGVMYEIFVRSFYDRDNDGIGDLRGIIQKLDYLNDENPDTDSDLGIELIWLMTIFESPSYHCYDVADYYSIETDYGTNDDFQELLKEAHKHGIHIITDLVLNHCSSQHPFFQDAYGDPKSKYGDWFFFTNKSNTRAHNWQFRHREEDRAMLEPYMPAWNVNNPDVQKYLFDIALYWMDPNGDGDFSDGIDGFRCDYVKGPPDEFWNNFRQTVKSLNPDVLLLAENWDGLVSISHCFDDKFDMAFDFPFQGGLMETITSANGRELRSLLEQQKDILPKHAVMNRFINNHDMNRIFTRLNEDQAKLGLSLLLTMPDMPMLYYGDEIGMKGEKDPYDEGIRRPMEWCADNNSEGTTWWYPVWNKKVDGISVEEEEKEPDSILNYVKKLIRLREDNPVLENGIIKFLPVYLTKNENTKEYIKAISYVISDENNFILVIANLLDKKELSIDLSELKKPEEFENMFFNKVKLKEEHPFIRGEFPARSVQIYKLKF